MESNINLKTEVLSIVGKEIKEKFFQDENYSTVEELSQAFYKNKELLAYLDQTKEEFPGLINENVSVLESLTAYLVELGPETCKKRFSDYAVQVG